MVSFYDVDPLQLNKSVAAKLKEVEQVQQPDWALFVRTGTHTQRPPVEGDWWYARAAALLITVAKKGPVGVNKLRVKFGGRKRRGHQPAQFRKASGSIIRNALQQLEAAQLIEQKTIQNHKGRVVTGKGHSLLAQAAKAIQSA